MRHKPWSILVAGGASRRLAGAIPKQFRALAGTPVYRWGLQALHAEGGVVVVVPAADEERVARECAGLERVRVVGGGARRQDSVASGVKAVPDDADIVLIHDAARPLIPLSMVRRVIAECDDNGMAIPVLPVPDTVKASADGHWVRDTVDRRGLFLAQTPQACRRPLLERIVTMGAPELTDEAQGAELLGIQPRMVQGSTFAFKITTGEDFVMAEAIADWLLRFRRCDEDWHWLRRPPDG